MSLESWTADNCPAPSLFFDNDPRSYFKQQSEEWLAVYRGVLSDDSDAFELSTIWDYAKSQMIAWIIPAIFGAMVLLAWLPLWMSRCCAHRCCAPKTPHFSRRFKMWGVGCFSCWSVVLLAFSAIGIVAVNNVNAGTENALCVTNGTLRTSSAWTGSIGGVFTGANSQIAAATSELDTLDTQLACLARSHEAGRNPCDAYRNSVQRPVDDLVNGLRAASACNADCEGLASDSATARDALCDAFASSALDEIRSAESAIAETRDLAGQFVVLIDTWVKVVGEVQSGLDKVRDFLDGYVKWYEDSGVAPYMPYVGVAFFAGTILACLLAVMAALCMHRTSNKRKACCNGIGVQVSGGAWVFHSAASPYYFLFASACLLLLVALYDHAHVLERTPYEFTTLYAGTRACDSDVTVIENAGGTGEQYEYTLCNVVGSMLDGCFKEDPQPWTDLTLAAFGADYTMAYFRDLLKPDDGGLDTEATLGAVDNFNVTQARASIDVFETRVCGLTAGDLGVPPSAVDATNANLAELCAAGTAVVALVREPLECYVQLADSTKTLVAASNHIIDTTLPALEGVSCGWMKVEYEVLVEQIYTFGGPWVLLIVALICVAAASVFLLASTIVLQVIFGDVGRRAGCPARCRCCCPAGRPVRVSRGGSSNFLGTKTEPAVKAPNEVSGNLISV